MSKLQDKPAINQLLAALMVQPSLLDNKSYKFSIDDFVEKIHKIIFGAILNLYANEAKKIGVTEIDSHLRGYTEQYRIFDDNSGIEYLQHLESIAEPDNFEMHYQRIKKFSFLRECRKIGIDITDIYDDKVVDLKEEALRNERFDTMTINDMAKTIELKINNLKQNFVISNFSNGGHMADNIEEIVESKRTNPSYGAPTASKYLNYILRGSRKKKLYLKHGNTGSGKSRFGMANLAIKTIPTIWDSESKTWISTGANGIGLFISTELDEEETKLPFLCYIADVEEHLIHENKLTKDQQERIDVAQLILKNSNLYFEELSDFDIEDIETLIVSYVATKGIEYVEFDYIHMSLKILTSLSNKGVRNLREDQILLLMGIALKNICNKYEVHIESSTQLNDNQNQNNNMDHSWIRGSKALADKIDGGYIILDLREKDKKIVDTIYASGAVKNASFGLYPNVSLNVYKNRGGHKKRIRIFGYFDKGTLRFTDLFCTNYNGELVIDIDRTSLVMNKELALNPPSIPLITTSIDTNDNPQEETESYNF